MAPTFEDSLSILKLLKQQIVAVQHPYPARYMPK